MICLWTTLPYLLTACASNSRSKGVSKARVHTCVSGRAREKSRKKILLQMKSPVYRAPSFSRYLPTLFRLLHCCKVESI